MSIVEYSWADLGYRRLGAIARLPNDKIDPLVVQSFTQIGAYSYLQPDWIRHRGRKANADFFSATIHDYSATDFSTIVRKCFDDERTLCGDAISWKSPSEQEAILKDSDSADQPWTALYYLNAALTLSGTADNFTKVLEHEYLPRIRQFYPCAQFVFVKKRFAEIAAMAAALRTSYALAQVPRPDWPSLAPRSLGVEILREWHSQDPMRLFDLVIDISNYLWYPFVTGVTMGRLSMTCVCLLDPPPKYELPGFPRDWFDFLLQGSRFGVQHHGGLEVVVDRDHPSNRRLAHGRRLVDAPPACCDRVSFLTWLVQVAADWIYNISDIANFPSASNNEIDARFGFEHLLTVERILRRTAELAVGRHFGSPKTVVFEIADLYATLAVRFNKSPNDAEFFKELFNPRAALASLSSRLEQIPGVGQILSGVATEVYTELLNIVVESVCFRAKVTTEGVFVRSKSLID